MSDGGAQFKQFGPFFTSAGVLHQSIQVEHFDAGTSNIQTVWTDENKATPAAQPVVADTSGIASFYADGILKIIIKDSSGNILYTWDNYNITRDVEGVLKNGTSFPSVISNNTWQMAAKLDGSGNLTNIGINNGTSFQDINTGGIPSSTFANLPTPSLAGKLAYATDTIKGLYLDNARQYLSITSLHNLADFATGGTGTSADPWTGWETTSNFVANGGYFVPVGVFATDVGVNIQNKSNIHFVGTGAGSIIKSTFTTQSGNSLLEFRGSADGLTSTTVSAALHGVKVLTVADSSGYSADQWVFITRGTTSSSPKCQAHQIDSIGSSTVITLKTGITWDLDGTEAVIEGTTVENILVSDIAFEGIRPASDDTVNRKEDHGVYFHNGVANSVVNRCYFKNLGSRSIMFFSYSAGCSAISNVVTYASHIAIEGHSFTFKNRIIGNDVTGGDRCISMQGTAGTCTGNSVSGAQTNTAGERGAGITVAGFDHSITGNSAAGCIYGYDIQTINSITFSGNAASWNKTGGIFLPNGAANIAIRDGSFIGNGTINGDADIVSSNGISNLAISGNTFIDSTSGFTKHVMNGSSAAYTNINISADNIYSGYISYYTGLAGGTTFASNSIQASAASVDTLRSDSLLLSSTGTVIVGHLSTTASLNFGTPGAVPGVVTANMTVTGAALGDTVSVSSFANFSSNYILTGRVTAADTVTLYMYQLIGAAADPDSAGNTYRADVWKH